MRKIDESILNNLRSYNECCIDVKNLNLDSICLSVAIIKTFAVDEDNYMIYENKDANEIAIGIGKYLSFKIHSNKALIIKEDKQEEIIINSISEDIYNMAKSINMNNWRMYGIANFDYAKNTYKINEKSIEELMEFFIPNIDIRIKDDKVVVNYFNEEDILLIKECIRQSSDNNTPAKNIINSDLDKIKSKDEEYYKDIVSKAVKEIKEDKYEKVILSRKIQLEQRFDLTNSYIVGRRENTPARSYCIKLEGFEVLGFSPETIVEVDKDKTVYTFPLAGTRALSNNIEKNRQLKEDLLKDPKEIAEHAVSVKLAYEELEQICEKGSVSVVEFMEVLERGTVQHLASRLKGKIKEEMNEWHAFKALFPAVTASGIPKKQCIEAIDRLEKDGRGLYSGGVLTYDKDGTLDVALVLRTAFQNEKESWTRVGAGIVKLSTPERELEETKEKIGSIVNQLVYIED